jgi:hypothetical protein
MRAAWLVTGLLACGDAHVDARTLPFAADAFEHLDVRADHADVVITSEALDGVDAEAALRASLSWGGELAPSLDTHMVGGTLRVDTSCEEVQGCGILLELRVPDTTAVDLDITRGTIAMTGLSDDVDVQLEAGSVDLVDLSGSTEVHITRGDLTLDGVTGRLDAYLPGGDLVGTGLQTDVLDVVGDAGQIGLSFAGPPSLLVASTTTGDIELTLPAGTYDLDVASERGLVTIDGIDDAAGADSVVIVESARGQVTVTGN